MFLQGRQFGEWRIGIDRTIALARGRTGRPLTVRRATVALVAATLVASAEITAAALALVLGSTGSTGSSGTFSGPATVGSDRDVDQVIGQITVCSGCCCGAVGRGKPEVPLDWLKQEWRSRGLLKNLQLTVSGCLGPCDLPNVVRISGPTAEIWIGNLDRREQYASLVEWASESKAAGTLLALPESFDSLKFSPFRPAAT